MIACTVKLTDACNQKCGFCSDLQPRKLSFSEAKNIIYSVDSSERVNFDFSGGEPTLVSWLPKIITYAKRSKDCSISIQTNGMAFSNAKYAENLKRAGLDSARVSLHSHIGELADSITGAPNTLKKTLEGIKNLIKLNIRVGISFVINSLNYRELPSFAKFICINFPDINRFAFAAICEPKNYTADNRFILQYSAFGADLRKTLKYLKNKKKTVTLCGIPFCVVPGYEGSIFLGQFQRDFVKDKQCGACGLNEVCPGIMKEYADFYGTSEARPYKGNCKKIANNLQNKNMHYISFNSCYSDKGVDYEPPASEDPQGKREVAIFEKKKHLIITTLCNNNCKFCLMGKEKYMHLPLPKIKAELRRGVRENCTKLILSGGDPTIHPHIIDIVRYSKKVGYKKIQTITNGRMYSYPAFLQNMVSAGLDEITFSVHSDASSIHDWLTGVDGSFKQTVEGIKNAILFSKKGKLIVNADVVINKKNYRSLPEIIKFLYSIGITEVDFLQVTPFGYAWDNRQEIMYSSIYLVPYIKQAIDFGRSKGMFLWTNRLPAECLEGNEGFIQDSYKLIDEIEGRRAHFESCLSANTLPFCFGERCSYCVLDKLCRKLFFFNNTFKSNKLGKVEIKITSKNPKKEMDLAVRHGASEIMLTGAERTSPAALSKILKYAHNLSFNSIKILFSFYFNPEGDIFLRESLSRLQKQKKDSDAIICELIISKRNRSQIKNQLNFLNDFRFDAYELTFPPPPKKLSAYKQEAIRIGPILKEVCPLFKTPRLNFKIRNIPPCFFKKGHNNKILQDERAMQVDYLNPSYRNIELMGFAEDFLRSMKVKSFRCRECAYDKSCDGVFRKYVELFGFRELKPVK